MGLFMYQYTWIKNNLFFFIYIYFIRLLKEKRIVLCCYPVNEKKIIFEEDVNGLKIISNSTKSINIYLLSK